MPAAMNNSAVMQRFVNHSDNVPTLYRHIGPGPQGFEIDDLGSFGAFDANCSVIPSDVNDAGLVVGAVFFLPAAPTGVAAFSYTKAGGIVNLNTTPNAGGNSIASGVNGSGQIAFMADHSGGGGGYVPARFAAGALTFCPLLALPGYNAVPPASYYTGRINAGGDIVGEAISSATASLPFVSDGTTTRSLGSLGGSRGGAAAINVRGEIVGYSQTKTTPQGDPWNPGHAFRYTANAGLIDLNQLVHGGPGAWELRAAYAINAPGEIVGYGEFTPNPPATPVLRAYHFAHGVVHNLGTSPNGGISAAKSISDRGEIVGYAYFDASGVGNRRACIFLPRLGAVDLNYLINPTLGWNLIEANAINNHGQIVGYGTLTGLPGIRGFLLTPTI